MQQAAHDQLTARLAQAGRELEEARLAANRPGSSAEAGLRQERVLRAQQAYDAAREETLQSFQRMGMTMIPGYLGGDAGGNRDVAGGGDRGGAGAGRNGGNDNAGGDELHGNRGGGQRGSSLVPKTPSIVSLGTT